MSYTRTRHGNIAILDGIDEAEILFNALDKLGGLLPQEKKGKTKEYGSIGGTLPSLPEGIDKKKSFHAHEFNRNPKLYNNLLAEARKSVEEIPSVRKILNIINKKKPKPESPPLPEGIFNVIYADPPWKYSDTCEEGAIQSKGADKHYPVMSIDELCDMPIKLCAGKVVRKQKQVYR